MDEELQRLGWAEALWLFAASELRPDAFVFGVLANGCGKASEWRQALQCLEDMRQQRLWAAHPRWKALKKRLSKEREVN